jgi:large subunit ribosomal protein L16
MKDFKPIFFKYKKYHNSMIIHKLWKKEFKHFKLFIGIIGLKALKSNIIDGAQIGACIKNIARDCKRKYKVWIYCYPNISLTAKSISVRMGKGIGSIINWIFVIKKNNIFIELIGKYKHVLFKSLRNCKKKISFSTKIILNNYIKKWKNFKNLI